MTSREGQKRLGRIADAISNGTLAGEDKDFIVDALEQIASGQDPKSALNVKARRGERTGAEFIAKQEWSQTKKTLAIAWIATAISSESDGGFGLTIDQAICHIGENSPDSSGYNFFEYTEETLRSYWKEHQELRVLEFKLGD